MDAVNVEGVRNALVSAKTKEAGRELVAEFAREHQDLDVRTLLVGPVNTELFAKGKPNESQEPRVPREVTRRNRR